MAPRPRLLLVALLLPTLAACGGTGSYTNGAGAPTADFWP